jgi:hypothetical protein
MAVVLGLISMSPAPAVAQATAALAIRANTDVRAVTVDLTSGAAAARPAVVSLEIIVENTTDDLVEDATVAIELPPALRHPEGAVLSRRTGELGAAALWREVIAVSVDPAAAVDARVVGVPATVTAVDGSVARTETPSIEFVVISSTSVVPATATTAPPAAAIVPPTTAPPPAEVRGVVYTPELPRTGVAPSVSAALALSLVVLGAGLVRAGRTRKH